MFMKKFSIRVLALSSALAMTMFFSQIARSDHDYETYPGGNCKSANQLQSLLAGWDQFGVRNPAPIGGVSFFVLCPLMKIGIMRYQGKNPLIIDVSVTYETPAAIPVTCTFRSIDSTDEGNQTAPRLDELVTVAISEADSPTPDIDTVPINVPNAGNARTDGSNQWTLVCAVHPQTRINHYSVRANNI